MMVLFSLGFVEQLPCSSVRDQYIVLKRYDLTEVEFGFFNVVQFPGTGKIRLDEVYQGKTTKSPADPAIETSLVAKAGLSFRINGGTSVQAGFHLLKGFTKLRESEDLSGPSNHEAMGIFLGMMTQLKKTLYKVKPHRTMPCSFTLIS